MKETVLVAPNLTPETPPRLGSRVVKAIPILLRGTDKSGTAFVEQTQTINVSAAGAKLLTTHRLNEGSRLQVEVPHLEKTTWATVAWLGTRFIDAQEIGIALQDTHDFWHLEAPDEKLGREEAGRPLAASDPLLSLPGALAHALEQMEQRITEKFSTELEAAVKVQVKQEIRSVLRSARGGIDALSAFIENY